MLTCILASCSDGGNEDPVNPTPEQEENKAEITIDSGIISNGLSFDAAQGEQSVSFSANTDWTLSVASTTSGTTWCKPSATSGKKGSANVKFTIDENTEYDDRSVSVTIKAGTESKTFTITQKGTDALLVTTNKYEVSQEGGTIEVEVKANIDYQMEISESAKDWITESSGRSLTAYKHTFEIALNEGSEKREGEIIFKSGDKVETVKVYQTGGAILLLSQNEFIVSDAGETISVDVKSNVEYGVQMPDVNWIIDEASSRGMSSHTLKYVISANEGYDGRSAEIIFYDKNSDLKDTLKVIQSQKDAIVISKKEYDVNSEGEIIEIELNSNVDFDIFIEDDWVTQVESKSSRGLVSYKLYFQIVENNTEEERSTKISITDENKPISDTIVIKQNVKKVMPNNQIWYTSSDGHIINPTYIVSPFYSNPFGATIISNTYEDGKGIITFDKDLTSIGDYAFFQCENLTNMVIPNSVTIMGNSLFSQCFSLKNVIIPNSVTTIGDNTFAHCSSLAEITIPNSVTSIGNYMFYGCKSLTEIIIPNNVISIGDQAFYQCYSLKGFIIPNSVTTIGKFAFSQCSSLTNITIPNNVISIGHSAFGCSSLKNIIVETGNSVYDSRENCNGIIETSTNTLIQGCGKTIIPNSVTTIGNYAFYCCSSMTEFTIPESVTTIGSESFALCHSLANITIPNSVISIGFRAFYNCNALKEITISNGVINIEDYAFIGCSSLEKITISKSVNNIGFSIFAGCSSLANIIVEEGNLTYDSRENCNGIIETATNTLIQGCEKTIIPNSVTTIGNDAFFLCTSLTEIAIPNSVTIIKNNAFDSCTSLKEITIPNNVTSIGNEAFWECSSMLKVNIKATIPPTIASGTFEYCRSDLKIYVPAASLKAYEKADYWKDMNLLPDN